MFRCLKAALAALFPNPDRRLEAAAREAYGLLVVCGQEFHPATRELRAALPAPPARADQKTLF